MKIKIVKSKNNNYRIMKAHLKKNSHKAMIVKITVLVVVKMKKVLNNNNRVIEKKEKLLKKYSHTKN